MQNRQRGTTERRIPLPPFPLPLYLSLSHLGDANEIMREKQHDVSSKQELTILCGAAEIGIVVFSPAEKPFSSGSDGDGGVGPQRLAQGIINCGALQELNINHARLTEEQRQRKEVLGGRHGDSARRRSPEGTTVGDRDGGARDLASRRRGRCCGGTSRARGTRLRSIMMEVESKAAMAAAADAAPLAFGGGAGSVRRRLQWIYVSHATLLSPRQRSCRRFPWPRLSLSSTFVTLVGHLHYCMNSENFHAGLGG
ncbi:hypothetical protein AXF42_Ash010275 [Apostasia shenzhenica]|uniref:Uncharacterized protein n=1 Tax=Apostasia shenzhenica TaxID=1088818 RepID=A0A2I0AA10_9ASPA|nr:hypothetical protein AXF42_Ash010275 [Apostasia shenzhenica]